MDELRRGESEQGGEDVIQSYQWQLSRTTFRDAAIRMAGEKIGKSNKSRFWRGERVKTAKFKDILGCSATNAIFSPSHLEQ